MPKGKPDPGCVECKGTGEVVLFTSSVVCECVDYKSAVSILVNSIKGLEDRHNDFEHKHTPMLSKKHILRVDPKVLEGLKRMQLSAEYIADGISTWNMWPGIEGHICNGCGAQMNVLGMSYNHWCPLCDPEEKEHVFQCMSHHRRVPFDYPVFGPSIDTIREGCITADVRRKKNE